MTKVLVTGFGPFGFHQANPTGDVLPLLKPRGINLATATLPVAFQDSSKMLQGLLEQHTPDLTIALGLTGMEGAIKIERVAINVDDARIPDNLGQQPVDQPTIEGGPVGYWSSLPLRKIGALMDRKGVKAQISETAGTYVCNHVFYHLCHLRETRYPQMTAGFIHIPPLASLGFSLDELARLLEEVLACCLDSSATQP